MVCYENGHDNLCRQFTEEFSLTHLINQKNKACIYSFSKYQF